LLPYDIRTSRVALGRELTIIVIFGSDCPACVQSAPFYKKLLELPTMDGTAKRLVIMATDGIWPVKKLLDAHGLSPHQLISYPLSRKWDVPAEPPTLVAFDGSGARLGLWAGQLTTGQQEQVLSVAAR
jgi:hypothetical protein